MSGPEVVLYGASGYTGKLVSWHLAEYGIPFIAAGRSKDRLELEMKLVPELADHPYEVAEVQHDRASLAALFTGKKVVYNFVGPFMQLSECVVQACLDAGCHYLDSTGETDWVMMLRDKYGAAFAEKGLLLSPASAYMWQSGVLAAEIALETPGIDTLDILYFGTSDTSEASTMSFLRMCTNPQHYLENNELAMWPYAKSYQVKVPDLHRTIPALPWSGGGEPIWYQNDDRVRNCHVLTAFGSPMFIHVIKILEDFEVEHRHKSQEEREAATNAIGHQLVAAEPAREVPEVNRTVTSVLGRGDRASVEVVIHGNCGYRQTGLMGAEFIRRILAGKILKTGFQAATHAFGARNIINALAERGYYHSTPAVRHV